MFRRIITWNAQGAVLADTEKKQVLNNLTLESLQAEKGLPVFCIQEAGIIEEQSRRTYLARRPYQYEQFTPYDFRQGRCCLALIYPLDTGDSYQCYPFSTREESRPVACLEVNGMLSVANIHATAYHAAAVEDVADTIDNLNNKTKPWILLGDMNCDPDELVGRIASNCIICSTGHATHSSGSELDYAVIYMDPNMELADAQVRIVAPSDHNPVVFDFNSAF